MDPISDMFIRLQNAYLAGHETVLLPFSRAKAEIARVLKREGYIADFEKKGKRVRKFLELHLVYSHGAPALIGIRRVSKSSRRLYATKDAIMRYERGARMLILSTPNGMLSGDEAMKSGVGGEVIAKVW
mgnify:CR=1 FL=1